MTYLDLSMFTLPEDPEGMVTELVNMSSSLTTIKVSSDSLDKWNNAKSYMGFNGSFVTE